MFKNENVWNKDVKIVATKLCFMFLSAAIQTSEKTGINAVDSFSVSDQWTEDRDSWRMFCQEPEHWTASQRSKRKERKHRPKDCDELENISFEYFYLSTSLDTMQ